MMTSLLIEFSLSIRSPVCGLQSEVCSLQSANVIHRTKYIYFLLLLWFYRKGKHYCGKGEDFQFKEKGHLSQVSDNVISGRDTSVPFQIVRENHLGTHNLTI